MKRICLLILAALTLASLVSTHSQTPQSGELKKVQVTAKTIGSQATSTPLRLDLSRNGQVYEVARLSYADYSRVEVLTSRGTVRLSDLVSKFGLTGSKFVIGRFSDLFGSNFAGTFQPAGPSAIECNIPGKPDQCSCHGSDQGTGHSTDCDKLGNSGNCDSTYISACSENPPGSPPSAGKWTCYCYKKGQTPQ